MLRIVRTAIVVMLVSAMLFSACAFAKGEDRLSIVCTSFPCYDFTRAVAGDAADIHLLIKPGMEVHSFEPTPADVLQIAGCDLFVYIGGESDAWVLDILDSFGSDVPETLRMFDCVDAIEAEAHDHNHADHEYDEHIWTAPSNALAMVDALANAISGIDAARTVRYLANAELYKQEISAFDAEIRAVVESAQRREMIFADRFPFIYFACEYDLQYEAAFPSCSSESEPSAKTIAGLIDKVAADEIPVVYILELSSGKTAQTIAAETGAQILTFHSIQNVSEADFSAGETYVSLMQRNIDALKEGLN